MLVLTEKAFLTALFVYWCHAGETPGSTLGRGRRETDPSEDVKSSAFETMFALCKALLNPDVDRKYFGCNPSHKSLWFRPSATPAHDVLAGLCGQLCGHWSGSPCHKPWSGKGPRATRMRRDQTHQPITVEQLARELPEKVWRQVAWREGSKETLRSRFAAWRVRPAYDDDRKGGLQPEQWLLVEWPAGAAEPSGHRLARLAAKISLKRLVGISKHRWVIERDYEELKQELGLGHYEGRNWRGFHHHGTLCIAAYGFAALLKLSWRIAGVEHLPSSRCIENAPALNSPASQNLSSPERSRYSSKAYGE